MTINAMHRCGPVARAWFVLLTQFVPSATLFAQDGEGVLEEIVVTAQKRAEASQEIGITMTVMDEELMEALNLQALPQAALYIPNVELFEDYPGAGIPTWVIRGVGLQDFNSNNTPTAAVYVDESYQTSTVMGAASLFDVERLEVLKGPQGGLYGRNTSGGAVLLHTRGAVLGERSGHAQLGYGRWQDLNAEAAFNLPLGERVAWRAAGRLQQSDDGWQTSLSDGSRHGDKQAADLRSWLLFQPRDDVRVRWKLQAGEDDSEILLGRAVGLYSPTGGYCSAVLAGRRNDETCLSFAGLNKVLAGEQAPSIASQSADGSLVLSDPLNRQRNDYLSSVLDIRTSLAFADFVSITALDDFDYGVDLDLDGSIGEYAHRLSGSDIKTMSQEFRLVSPANGPMGWLAGLTLSEEEFLERRDFLLRDNHLVGLGQGKLNYDQETSMQALFGSLTAPLGDALSLVASLRYTREEKEYRNGDFFIPAESPVYLVRDVSADYRLDSRWSGKLGLDWQVRDDLMLYASLSRGFKSGGFYGGFPFSPAEVDPYQEETIDAWEMGFKGDWADARLRLNGAVFYYDYRDVQGFIREINPVTGTGIDRLGNQGDAEHSGMELQLEWLPAERLELALDVAYLDARFLDSGVQTRNIEGTLVNIEGRRPYAPHWSSAGRLTYRGALGGWGTFTTLSYHYRSEFSGDVTSPVDLAVNRLEGYGLLDATFALSSSAAAGWELWLWSRNLLDETYRTRVKSDGLMGYVDLYGQPRSFGVSLQYSW